jgi:hypothetical protein
MVRPFVKGLAGTACPIMEIFEELAGQLGELRAMRKTTSISAPSGEGHEREDEDERLSVATITPRQTPMPISTVVAEGMHI